MSDKDLDDKLKPCPFCGGAAAFVPFADETGENYMVTCTVCAADSASMKRPEGAARKWNRRVKE